MAPSIFLIDLRLYCCLLIVFMASCNEIYVTLSSAYKPVHSPRSLNQGLFPKCGWKLAVTDHSQSEPWSNGMSCLRKSGQQSQWPLLNLFIKHTSISYSWFYLIFIDCVLQATLIGFICFVLILYFHDVPILQLLSCVRHLLHVIGGVPYK